MSIRRFPRNSQSRLDAIAGHRFHGPNNDQSRLGGFGIDGQPDFNSAGVFNVQSNGTVYEGVIASSGWTTRFDITNYDDSFNADAPTVGSAFFNGISSFGLALSVDSISRSNAKRVLVGVGPDATYVASAQNDITMTVARSGFTNRTASSEAAKLLRIEPFSISYTGPASIDIAALTNTTGIVATAILTLQNSLESFHAGITVAAAASWFVGLPVAQGSTFFDTARKVLTATIVGSNAGTVTGTRIKPTFAVTSSFVLRKAQFVANTLCIFV